MLRSHLDAVEEMLLAQARIVSNASHPVHKGWPREAFIREFLGDHLAENVAIGTGEIIDAASRPGGKRPQMDVVIYRRNYPKLKLGGGIHTFLAESVVATIEVKSKLTEERLLKAIEAAQAIKKLEGHLRPGMDLGYIPPGILTYVVAYEGPTRMETVYRWLTSAHQRLGIAMPSEAKRGVMCPSLDAVFVLGRGFVTFHGGAIRPYAIGQGKHNPQLQWGVADTAKGSLMFLFLLLTMSISGLPRGFDGRYYFEDVEYELVDMP